MEFSEEMDFIPMKKADEMYNHIWQTWSAHIQQKVDIPKDKGRIYFVYQGENLKAIFETKDGKSIKWIAKTKDAPVDRIRNKLEAKNIFTFGCESILL